MGNSGFFIVNTINFDKGRLGKVSAVSNFQAIPFFRNVDSRLLSEAVEQMAYQVESEHRPDGDQTPKAQHTSAKDYKTATTINKLYNLAHTA
jgi:hypothetical protein